MQVSGVVAGGVGEISEPALTGDAVGADPRGELHQRRLLHRFRERCVDLENSGGVFGTGPDDAAWTSPRDARGDLVDTVGQQCRRQRVPTEPVDRTAVEIEGQRAVPVDVPSTGEPVVLLAGGHVRFSWSSGKVGAGAPMGYTARKR